MKIKIKKLNPNAIMPTRGSEYAAGWDLYACIDVPVIIEPHTTVKIPSGLAVEIPIGYFGAVYARSGLATKQGLRPANCTGVIDCDYRGDITIALHNDTDEVRIVNQGERVAQLAVLPYQNLEFMEVDDLSDTVRSGGGFGSTGIM